MAMMAPSTTTMLERWQYAEQLDTETCHVSEPWVQLRDPDLKNEIGSMQEDS